jgi:hypothetical protein
MPRNTPRRTPTGTGNIRRAQAAQRWQGGSGRRGEMTGFIPDVQPTVPPLEKYQPRARHSP